jgi:nucleoside-diphosphate-sugar epimerase
METVAICEETYQKLKRAEAEESVKAEVSLKRLESNLSTVDSTRGGVLVTGGTGLLGKVVAAKLRNRKFFTRVVSRKIPPESERIPGVEYVAVDLAEEIPPDLLDKINLVVHCAAETAGGKNAHLRNSIGATKNILSAMGKAGISKFLFISSIAVLRSSHDTGKPVDESTSIVQNSEERGPYVWGKAESERLALELGQSIGVTVRIIRPGPLVNFDAFEPPGRLGREVGSIFVYIGGRRSNLSLCSVRTAADVIRKYVENFDSMPPILNLVEPNSPTRAELVSLLLKKRPDLKAYRIPFIVLRIISPGLKLLQRILRPRQKPIDIYAAFATERYKPDLAAEIINRDMVN